MWCRSIAEGIHIGIICGIVAAPIYDQFPSIVRILIVHPAATVITGPVLSLVWIRWGVPLCRWLGIPSQNGFRATAAFSYPLVINTFDRMLGYKPLTLVDFVKMGSCMGVYLSFYTIVSGRRFRLYNGPNKKIEELESQVIAAFAYINHIWITRWIADVCFT